MVLDLIFLIIFLGFMISGFKIGLVRSLVGLIGSVFAMVASVILANRFSGLIASLLLQGKSGNVLELTLTRVIVTVVIYMLLQMLVRMVVGALDTVFHLPLLHQVNQLLGGVFGLLKGALVIFLLCAVLQMTIPVFSIKNPNFVSKQIISSCIYQFTVAHNPIYELFLVEL